jgi:hypothetical protein
MAGRMLLCKISSRLEMMVAHCGSAGDGRKGKEWLRCASLFGRYHEDDVFLNWSLRDMDKKLSQVQHIQRTRPCFTYTNVVCRVEMQNGGRENVENRGKDMCKDRQIVQEVCLSVRWSPVPLRRWQAMSGLAEEK